VAREWSRSLLLVLLLYDCKEASKIDWKMDEDEDEEAIGEIRMMSGDAVLGPPGRYVGLVAVRILAPEDLKDVRSQNLLTSNPLLFHMHAGFPTNQRFWNIKLTRRITYRSPLSPRIKPLAVNWKRNVKR
jgi:hypothetical protein